MTFPKSLARPFLAPPAPGAVPPLKGILNYLLVCIAVIFAFWASLTTIQVTFDFGFVGEYQARIAEGFGLTVALSALSLVVSFLLGLAVAIGQGCRILFIRYLCDLYVKVIRGTPLIMQIYLFYYIVGTALGIDSRFVAGVLILSIFEGAYIAEIIRGSLLSLDGTQTEAARAVGFTRRQAVRHVVFPQMVARTLPALTGQFASIIKDSSLLSIIAVVEMAQVTREISAANFNLFEAYLLLGGLYLCLTLPIAAISRAFERRLDYAH